MRTYEFLKGHQDLDLLVKGERVVWVGFVGEETMVVREDEKAIIPWMLPWRQIRWHVMAPDEESAILRFQGSVGHLDYLNTIIEASILPDGEVMARLSGDSEAMVRDLDRMSRFMTITEFRAARIGDWRDARTLELV